MLVTIIIPMYNAEMYIERTLNCITAQTYSPLQVIIINDGSTDNSLDICKSFQDKIASMRFIALRTEGFLMREMRA